MYSEHIIGILRQGGPCFHEAKTQLLRAIQEVWGDCLPEYEVLMRKATGENVRLRLSDARIGRLDIRLHGYARTNWTDPISYVEADVPRNIIEKSIVSLQDFHRRQLLCAGFVEHILFLREELDCAIRDFKAVGGDYYDPDDEEKIEALKNRIGYLRKLMELETRYKPKDLQYAA